MEALPQELINRTVCFAERDPDKHEYYHTIHQSYKPGKARPQFPRLTILNGAWKEAVESITFRRLNVSNEHDLEDFQANVTGSRREYFSQIIVTVRLPEYPRSRDTSLEILRWTYDAWNENFTEALEDLFKILRKWEDDDWGFQDLCDFYEEESDLDPFHIPEYEDAREPKARRANRIGFARSLRRAPFHHLKSATITFEHEAPLDQRLPVPSLMPCGFCSGPFSTVLHIFSRNLTSLTLSAQVDYTLFWPQEEPATPPSWPNLTTLDITMPMVSPRGKWYFTGPLPPLSSSSSFSPSSSTADGTIDDPASDKQDYSNFRTHPDPLTFKPLLEALSKAALHMPVLLSLMLTVEVECKRGDARITYHAPCEKVDWGDEDQGDKASLAPGGQRFRGLSTGCLPY
ncbi:hypothetical protein COCMIDRAFT_23914 [Bipolaris oryzae ATCC 44560]|uniref:Uncharacterized protein n=1 Tax=Bipolaris oryzae ATCC 44560 TaxID=930090 RepID=W6ZLG4_COCMI|nr:uncharacterized protein COCMIDRAFT_23914 [Bipolaris oryzae ATCC 44560]EUC48374.1 hypothetical protein COCMIDRAFT_23914 [Bipolaris oryzae ATCC 44560]